LFDREGADNLVFDIEELGNLELHDGTHAVRGIPFSITHERQTLKGLVCAKENLAGVCEVLCYTGSSR
jgi:hypothetical protein